MMKLLVILTVAVLFKCSFSLVSQSTILRNGASVRISLSGRSSVALRAAPKMDDDDDNRPKLQMQEDNLGPRVSVRSYEEVIQSRSNPTSATNGKGDSSRSTDRSSGSSATDSKTRESNVFGSLSVDDLASSRGFSRRSRGVSEKSGKIVERDDLNGIEPLTPFVFAPVPAMMSVASWQVSNFLSAKFAIQFVDSEFYPVQRLAIVSRNVLVGLFTLSTGFTAAITVGLLMLGVAVSVGVAKGELDPKKKKPDSPKDDIPGSIKRLFER